MKKILISTQLLINEEYRKNFDIRILCCN